MKNACSTIKGRWTVTDTCMLFFLFDPRNLNTNTGSETHIHDLGWKSLYRCKVYNFQGICHYLSYRHSFETIPTCISLWNSANFDRWTIYVGQVVVEVPPLHRPFRVLPRFTLISGMTKKSRKSAEFRGSADSFTPCNNITLHTLS